MDIRIKQSLEVCKELLEEKLADLEATKSNVGYGMAHHYQERIDLRRQQLEDVVELLEL